ncbi:glycosyltransferase family 4 protein [Mangrovihabitans endophyticus]|uniref:Glycosyl transferase n=1 Tax=Mangrovihabitans endophyticus TaxID=1751298 RepID=A0A8J3FR14_9ACTN|nr:glycosyltransferase family 4 protein [Mangrovihabitans endophyticus]GGL07977.1 glycosyl transferase [Mangrovihabitans endophyticus]
MRTIVAATSLDPPSVPLGATLSLHDLHASGGEEALAAGPPRPAVIRPRRSPESDAVPATRDAGLATDRAVPEMRYARQSTRPADPGWRPLRIAMIGQKGVPATYGGIERHVEELSSRLVALGHEVTVYCRRSYEDRPPLQHRGVRLRPVPTVASKHLDAIVHAATSTVAALRDRPDIVHYHGLGPGLVAPLPRYLSGVRVVQTAHGLDQQRAKWSRVARAALDAAHWMSGHVPHARVAVSRTLEAHYRQRFPGEVRYIPNGVGEPRRVPAAAITDRFALLPGGYVLLVGRLVPEKAAEMLIRAFRRVRTDLRLAVVGGSAFTDGYVRHLHAVAAADPRVVFTGFAYEDLLAELYTNAAVFVQPSRLEGLPLTLLEAGAYGLPLVASDIAPHRELLGVDGPGHRLFRDGDEDDLVRALSQALDGDAAERHGALEHGAHLRAAYTWDGAAREVERLYLSLVGSRSRRGRPG